ELRHTAERQKMPAFVKLWIPASRVVQGNLIVAGVRPRCSLSFDCFVFRNADQPADIQLLTKLGRCCGVFRIRSRFPTIEFGTTTGSVRKKRNHFARLEIGRSVDQPEHSNENARRISRAHSPDVLQSGQSLSFKIGPCVFCTYLSAE